MLREEVFGDDYGNETCIDVREIGIDVAFLSEQIGRLTSVERLVLTDCLFPVLPPSITQLEQLNELELHFCEGLEGLPDALGQLQSLTTLCLYNCLSLERLPESMGQLQSLVEFSLTDCTRLDTLPESMGQLQSLTELDLRGCTSLERLPESMGQLQSLTKLALEDCTSLERLPESMGQLQSLTYLNLFRCTGLQLFPTEGWRWSNIEYRGDNLRELMHRMRLPLVVRKYPSALYLKLYKINQLFYDEQWRPQNATWLYRMLSETQWCGMDDWVFKCRNKNKRKKCTYNV